MEDLFQFFLGLNKQQLQDAARELKGMTPDHMGTMLVDKESREEAIRKREERLRMVTRDVPPTSDPTAGPSTLPGKPLYTMQKIIFDMAWGTSKYYVNFPFLNWLFRICNELQ